MNLTVEYPESVHFAEMTLVDMLTEKRSWNDSLRIIRALSHIRTRAKSLQDERKLFSNEDSQEAGPATKPLSALVDDALGRGQVARDD